MPENYQIKLKDLDGEKKAREKLIKYGPDVLKNFELLSIISNLVGDGSRII